MALMANARSLARAFLLAAFLFPLLAADPAVDAGTPRGKSVEELTEKARPSVVIITQRARDGSVEGVGSGFVVHRRGLIATSLHVIGEGRPIEVRFANGDSFPVQEIHAWDRKLDLAIIRVAASNLPALKLADSADLKQGARVVAMGNPRGLAHSVVQGVVSAFRDFSNGRMIQLAIPIEPGNSGGPLLDSSGRVAGILEMKSAVTDNLGFAIPVDSLKTLLDKPNPVPIDRWITLGALDPRLWKSSYGAHWTRRAGEIRVTGSGTGFGGRSLCFHQPDPPALPYELSVTTRLDDESGAAGLIFAADRADRHYGFYPSGGQLRLTRFDGPDVFSWNILEQKASPAYLPGDWNTLRVQLEKDLIRCFVNGQLVFESRDDALRLGAVGLAKFRHTQAQFKNFSVRPMLPVEPGPASTPALASRAVLLAEAKKRDQEAADLRRQADSAHLAEVQSAMLAEFKKPEPEMDLFKSALLVSRLDNPDLELEPYREELAAMAGEITRSLPSGASAESKLERLINYLFHENGFHGSRGDYYNRSNSYINEVIDDREGIPITLSILFLELARLIGLDHLSGVPLPGHFILQFAPPGQSPQYIDVFDGGRLGNRERAAEWARAHSEVPIFDEHFRLASKKEMIIRMLRNLISLASPADSPAQALRYLDLAIAVDSGEPSDRWRRAVLRWQSGNLPGAREDLAWLVEKQPPGVNMDRVEELLRSL